MLDIAYYYVYVDKYTNNLLCVCNYNSERLFLLFITRTILQLILQ